MQMEMDANYTIGEPIIAFEVFGKNDPTIGVLVKMETIVTDPKTALKASAWVRWSIGAETGSGWKVDPLSYQDAIESNDEWRAVPVGWSTTPRIQKLMVDLVWRDVGQVTAEMVASQAEEVLFQALAEEMDAHSKRVQAIQARGQAVNRWMETIE